MSEKPLFSNTQTIGHSKDTFHLSFGFTDGKATLLVARIVLTPEDLVKLMGAMEQAVASYEDKVGPIGGSMIQVPRLKVQERPN